MFRAQMAEVGTEPGGVADGKVGVSEVTDQVDRSPVTAFVRRGEDAGLDQISIGTRVATLPDRAPTATPAPR
ncbi:hypothetical protein AB1484_32345 [Parafrankia sp. FMc6]|uniref:hypothetical protein n=1 Tax=Parafrankia soli TaxID=2599596 RepID=UPI0034D3F62E